MKQGSSRSVAISRLSTAAGPSGALRWVGAGLGTAAQRPRRELPEAGRHPKEPVAGATAGNGPLRYAVRHSNQGRLRGGDLRRSMTFEQMEGSACAHQENR